MPAWMTSLLREEVSVPIALRRFEHDHLAAGQRQRAGDREPDDAGADDDAIDRLHGHVPPSIGPGPVYPRRPARES